jgi:riboflavin kinase, archaea type
MERELLRGRVAGGIGDLAHWMIEYADVYERKMGVRLYPGSLNVVLPEPWIVVDPPLRLEASVVGVGMNIVPCEIEGVEAFILRTDKNNDGRGDHEPNVIEIAAPVHLRSVLGLQDGDEVEVVVPNRDQGPIGA